MRADNPQVYFDLALGRYGDATPLVRTPLMMQTSSALHALRRRLPAGGTVAGAA